MTQRAVLSLVAALGLALAAAACSDDPEEARKPQGKKAAAGVDLAAISAWGTGENGPAALETDLLRRNIYVLLDGSGSMNRRGCSGSDTKRVAAQDALARFAKQVPADTNLGLAAFDKKGGTSERVPLGVANRPAFVQAVRAVGADSGTPLGKAIELAVGKLAAQAARQLGYGDYTLLVVTDGRADDIRKMEQVVDSVLGSTPIRLHTIGFCIDEKHALNRPGRTVYRSAMNASELASNLRAVLAESEGFDVDSFSDLN